MNELTKWFDALQCPDCNHSEFKPDSKESASCAYCNRTFERSQGIWNFLPAAVSNREGKEKEKEGWKQRFEDEKKNGWDPPPELFLQLPYYPYPYYEEAAEYLEIVMQYGRPWQGKRVLEIGAAECWASRHFAEAGSEVVALDYDPSRMIKAQIILDKLPVHFLRFTGDGESLPFRTHRFDCVFCCSVLHHFFDVPKAVREISRILKPGGTFFAIHEAFHPPHFSKEEIEKIHEDTPMNISYGINEQSFTAGYYRRIFSRAGLKLDLIHPRWDTRQEGKHLIVKPGAGIYRNIRYVPELLNDAAKEEGLIGKVAGWLLRSGNWRFAAHPKIFPLIRFQILNWTRKTKIMAAKKPPLIGTMAAEDLWIRAVIHTQERGPLDAKWRKGGGFSDSDRLMTWGYFYTNPDDVYWGNENNPDIFVRIRTDLGQRAWAEFFHVSVPDAEVFSDYPYNGASDLQTPVTMSCRYALHSFENGDISHTNQEESNAKLSVQNEGQAPVICCNLSAVDDLQIGAVIRPADQEPVNAIWQLGGEGVTSRGDESVWGYFYADSSDIPGQGPGNPLVFVKIWFDMSNRLFVNFIHVSDQDIEVYSDFMNDSIFNRRRISVMDERYIRYEYWNEK